MADFDLLSFGDASLDVFIAPTEHEEFCTLDKKKCLICFNYADKIPVDEIYFVTGGNAANNAVGVTRLGLRAALVATLGGDLSGDNIIEGLKGEKVDTSFITRQENTISNYNTAVMYGGERTIFTYHPPYEYKFPQNLPGVGWAYLTSMGKNFAPFYTNLVEWAKKNSVRVGFNPGSSQMKAGVDTLRNLFPVLEILFVNKEEAKKFMGDGSDDIKTLLTGMVQLGVKKAVITDGDQGAYAYDGQKFYKIGVLPINAYERTGAGDSFGAGCMTALIQGKGMDETLLWGTVNSASVIGKIGPQAGLLTKDELPVWLDRAKSSGVRIEEL